MENDKYPRPMVGVSLLVVRAQTDQVLLSRRKGSHGAGEYGTPGGHQEKGETYADTALRELVEECGPKFVVSEPRFLCVTDLRDYLPEKHYTDIGMVSVWLSGEPRLMEPHKAEGWEWHAMASLPAGCFGAVRNLAASYNTGQPYFA